MTDIDALLRLVREQLGAAFVPGEDDETPWLPLATPSYSTDEIVEVLDSLLTGRVTMGEKVRQFEQAWASYTGTRHAVMVNSGSSANLLALSALSSRHMDRPLQAGDEVITTAIPWSTTVAPIVQLGMTPVFVDVDPTTFNIDVERIEAAITPKTRAIMPVHLVGNPVDMASVMTLAQRHDLLVIEDCCEAHGARFDGQHVGSFGNVGTFSFFFSHHITTIEGGMVVTNDDRVADLARSMRAHGWLRDVREPWEDIPQRSEFQADWVFATTGFNMRPTEVQGAFGIHQVPRLDGFIEARQANADYWNHELVLFEELIQLPRADARARHVWFAYPLLIKPGAPIERGVLLEELKRRGVATRPVISGRITAQPVIREWPHRISGELHGAALVHDQGFMVGNHQRVTDAGRRAVVDAITTVVHAARA